MENKIKYRVLTEKNQLILDNLKITPNFFGRLKGLMGKKELDKDEGLLIRPCNSIHTFFMRFNIDVLFVDKNNIIIKIYRDLLPWKISQIHLESKFCIEGNAGSFKRLKIGEKILITEKLD